MMSEEDREWVPPYQLLKQENEVMTQALTDILDYEVHAEKSPTAKHKARVALKKCADLRKRSWS